MIAQEATPYGGMTFAKFFPSDWRTGCLVLNLEEEGLYIRVCMYHYDVGKALPDDDAVASRLLNVHIHKYRKIMGSLVAKGKIIRAQGILFNERVQEEIDKYKLAYVARSRAAKAREEERKTLQLARAVEAEIARRQAATRGETPQTTPQTTPPVVPGVTTPVTPGSLPQSTGKKLNEINETQTTTEAEEKQTSGHNLEARSQNPEKKERVYQPASSMTPREEGLAGLNGSADPMIADIVGWMTGGDRQSAKNWLSTFLGQYAQEVVRESYFELKTQLADGKIISRPLQVWSKIAARLKATPRQKAAQEAPKESTRESILRFAEQAEAKLKREGHRV